MTDNQIVNILVEELRESQKSRFPHTFKEIGKELGIAESTAQKTFAQAIRKIRTRRSRMAALWEYVK
jgi:DNA-directed RNA polymerase sigma subunit (sigma70/sigma32)